MTSRLTAFSLRVPGERVDLAARDHTLVVVVTRLHRPRSVYAKTATFLALYTTAALLAGLVPFAGLPGLLPMAAVAVALVAAFVVGQQLVWAGFWSLFCGLLAAGVLVFSTFFGVHASTLAWRGVTMQATVTDVNTARSKGSTTYLYGLADARGRPIAGRLSELDDSFSVGTR